MIDSNWPDSVGFFYLCVCVCFLCRGVLLLEELFFKLFAIATITPVLKRYVHTAEIESI